MKNIIASRKRAMDTGIGMGNVMCRALSLILLFYFILLLSLTVLKNDLIGYVTFCRGDKSECGGLQLMLMIGSFFFGILLGAFAARKDKHKSKSNHDDKFIIR